jgi:ribosomal protein L37AE/L43A
MSEQKPICPDCGSKDTIVICGYLWRCKECGSKFVEEEDHPEFLRETVKDNPIDPTIDEEDDTGDNVDDPEDGDVIFTDEEF